MWYQNRRGYVGREDFFVCTGNTAAARWRGHCTVASFRNPVERISKSRVPYQAWDRSPASTKRCSSVSSETWICLPPRAPADAGNPGNADLCPCNVTDTSVGSARDGAERKRPSFRRLR